MMGFCPDPNYLARFGSGRVRIRLLVCTETGRQKADEIRAWTCTKICFCVKVTVFTVSILNKLFGRKPPLITFPRSYFSESYRRGPFLHTSKLARYFNITLENYSSHRKKTWFWSENIYCSFTRKLLLLENLICFKIKKSQQRNRRR